MLSCKIARLALVDSSKYLITVAGCDSNLQLEVQAALHSGEAVQESSCGGCCRRLRSGTQYGCSREPSAAQTGAAAATATACLCLEAHQLQYLRFSFIGRSAQ